MTHYPSFGLCLLTLLATGLLTACHPDQTGPGGMGNGFTASLEAQKTQTRTSLSGYTVLWSAGDTIAVYKTAEPSAKGEPFGLNAEDDGSVEGRFSSELHNDWTASACYALYPATMDGGLAGSTLSVNLPSEQQYRKNSFGPQANPAVARGAGDGKLAFKNLCGLLAVSVSAAEAIAEVRVTTLGSEALWGPGTVDMTYGEKPALVMAAPTDEAQKTLTLKVDETSDAVQFITDGPSSSVTGGVLTGDPVAERTYYLVVPAGALAEGFLVTVTTADGKFMQKYALTPGANRIERSVCVEMPSMAFSDESQVTIRTDVPQKAFYKDLFMNSGAGIGKFTTQPFVDYMGLEYEYFFAPRENFTAADLEKQMLAYGGSPEDLNGVLLYPDGEPRFKVIYTNGGYAVDHGRNLFATCREIFEKYFYNGGSYAGSCAGAMVSARGSVGNAFTSTAGYLGLWPGFHNSLSLTNIYPTYIFPENSPLLRYNDFGGDRKVTGVKHWNGPYFKYWFDAPGTEVLCINDLEGYDFDGLPSIIAYKPSIWSGRVIPIGGHPEQGEDEEQLNLMSSIIRYAIDGQGIAKAKGVLRNGEPRRMTKSTTDNEPAYTKVGDRQCHHFVFALPDKARNIKVRLESLEDFTLSLYLAEGTFAFKEDARYRIENADRVKKLTFDTLEKGTWYVGVQCEDVPTLSVGSYGYIYSGNTAVLNGAPYVITVTWE